MNSISWGMLEYLREDLSHVNDATVVFIEIGSWDFMIMIWHKMRFTMNELCFFVRTYRREISFQDFKRLWDFLPILGDFFKRFWNFFQRLQKYLIVNIDVGVLAPKEDDTHNTSLQYSSFCLQNYPRVGNFSIQVILHESGIWK